MEFFIKNDIVILAFFETIWLKYQCLPNILFWVLVFSFSFWFQLMQRIDHLYPKIWRHMWMFPFVNVPNYLLICQDLLFCYRTNRFITEKEWKNVVKERLRGRATVWKSKLEKMSHFVTKCLRKKDNLKNQTYFFEEFWHWIDSFQFTVSENVE